MRLLFTIARVPALLVLVPFLFSCGSYNQKIQKYYSQMEAGRFNNAFRTLDDIKFLQKPRNLFLYYAEKGRMAHLMGLYDSSNRFLNEADRIAEIRYKDAADVTKGTILNPMMQTYRGEPFERFMLHYYKALNYTYLGRTEEALVEARRISLATNDQMDQTNEKENRYSRDAFSLNLQGIIYESAGDMNNAFISYRNAVETYLTQKDSTWYGVTIPQQLKEDLLRTAHANGFNTEQERFEKIFGMAYDPSRTPEGGSLVVFMESGRAPVKEEENLFFSLVKGAGGAFFFTDPTGAFNIPFDVARYNNNSTDIGDLRTFRVALPKYMVTSSTPSDGIISLNEQRYQPEMVQNINAVAIETMKERRLKDITAALTRLAIKKLAESGARAASESIAKSNSKKKDGNKKEENAEAVGAAVGLLFQALAFASEKADTRNWQSLPAFIEYTRIPLQKGPNKLSIVQKGYASPKVLEVEGTGGLQVRNFRF